MSTKNATNPKIERLSRVLFPRHGIKNAASLVATIVQHRNKVGHVKIWRPEGGWGWFAAPGATAVTPSMVTLSFSSDPHRNAARARDELYYQLERATSDVASEDEIDAALARSSMAPRASRTNGSRKTAGQIEREIGVLTEMAEILERGGFDPTDAERLLGEGMGPLELAGRVAIASGVGSLAHSHGLRRIR